MYALYLPSRDDVHDLYLYRSDPTQEARARKNIKSSDGWNNNPIRYQQRGRQRACPTFMHAAILYRKILHGGLYHRFIYSSGPSYIRLLSSYCTMCGVGSAPRPAR